MGMGSLQFIRKTSYAAAIFCLLMTVLVHAQTTPQFTSTLGTSNNGWPLQSSGPNDNNRCQFLYAPGEFSTTGTGFITRVYIQLSNIGTFTPSSFTNLTFKMANTNLTGLPGNGNPWVPDMQTVYQSNIAINGPLVSGDWVGFTLQTPFFYNASQTLVVEISQDGYTGSGINIRQVGSSSTYTPRRMWGLTSSPTASGSGTDYANLGIDMIKPDNDAGVVSIDSPYTYCTPGTRSVKGTIRNFGSNQITGVTLNWSVNGIGQTSTTYPGTLDTFGGIGPNTAQVTFGNYSFTSTPVSIKAWTSNPNTTTDTSRINDTAYYERQLSMSGTYTIDPAGSGASNFTTFDAAIAALQAGGVCGPVTFHVAAATYNVSTPIIIPNNIIGLSQLNNITFDGGNGNAATRIITGNIPSSAVVIIQGRYVRLRNLTVTNTYAGGCSAIGILGANNNNNGTGATISRCIVNVPNSGSSIAYGICMTSAAGAFGQTNCNVDSVTIDSNTVTGAYFGIMLRGNISASLNHHFRVRANTITDARFYGISIQNVYNAIDVLGNSVNMLTTVTNDQYAIYLQNDYNSSVTVPHRIIGNKVINSSYVGISTANLMLNTGAAPTLIYNNMIGGGFRYTSSMYGITVSGANDIYKVYHNTVNLDFASTSTIYAFYYSASNSGLSEVKNNIFAVTSAAGTATRYPAFFNTNIIGNNAVNHNIYYNAYNNILLFRGAPYTTANYLNPAAGGDSSFSINPGFISSTDLRVTNTGCTRGVDLNAVAPLDHFGTTRSNPPVIGAAEYVPGVTNDIRVSSVLPAQFVAGAQNLTARVFNMGSNNVTSFNVSYVLNAGTPLLETWTGTLAPCASADIVFSGTSQITLDPGANNISVYTSAPNGSVDNNPANDTLKIADIYAGLSGTYTIDAGGTGSNNYLSFADAAADLQLRGVAGKVTFLVAPGTYTGPVIIGSAVPVAGISPVNTITFDGGDAAGTIITSSTSGNSTLLLNQCSYVTFRNFTISNTFSGNCVGVGIIGNTLSNSGTGCAIKRCIINVPNSGSGSSSYGISVTSTASGAGQSNNYMDSVVIDSNTITGAYYGIAYSGFSNNGANRGHRIRNNTVNNAYYMGIAVQNVYNPIEVLHNTVDMFTGHTGNQFGIYLGNNINSLTDIPHRIIGNKVTNAGSTGMYIQGTTSNTSVMPTQVYNNMVGGGFRSTSNIYGMQVGNGSSDVFWFYHNTINVDFASTSAVYGLYYQGATTAGAIKNNIFACTSVSGTAIRYPAFFNNNPAGGVINYNLYYNAYNNVLLSRGNVIYTTQNYLSTLAGGDSSFNLNPGFISSTDLRVRFSGCTKGVNVGVATDLFNNARATAPVIGAHEYLPVSNDASVISMSPSVPFVSGPQNLVARVQNMGNNTITSFTVTYRLNTGPLVTQSWTGSLAPCDIATITFSGAQQINIGGGIVNIQVYTTLPNGGADNNLSNDTLRLSGAYASLNGTYTIDPGGTGTTNYPSILSATNDLLLRGVAGPVTFLVAPGNYAGQVILGNGSSNIVGSSATNTITFDGGNAANTVITSSNQNAATLIINQCSYINLRNLTITNTYTGSCSGIGIVGNTMSSAGTGCTVKNCTVNLPNTGTSTSYGVVVTSSANGYGTSNMYTDSIAIDSNVINGGYYGIFMNGASNTAYNLNYKIRGNTVNNSYVTGIHIQSIRNPVDVLNNTINMSTVNNNDQYGISFTGNNNPSTVLPHRIHGNIIMNSSYSGINVSNTMLNTSSAPTQLFNNMVGGGFRYNSNNYGYRLEGNSNDLYWFYHNSVNMDYAPSNNNVYGLYFQGPSQLSLIKNNIFAISFTSGSGNPNVYPAYFGSTLASNNANYNVYHNTYNTNMVYRANVGYDVSNYNTPLAGGDSSFNLNPGFAGRMDLRMLTGGCIKGVGLPGIVTNDFQGNPRANPPVVGAHEYQSQANDISVSAIIQPSTPFTGGLQNLVAQVRNTGGNTVTSFTLSYRLNSGTVVSQPWTGSLAPCAATTITFSGAQQINIGGGVNNISVYTSLPNGFTDSNPVNDTLKILNTYASLNGVYTINPAGSGPNNYTTFGAATADLQLRGVAGPVTFIVSPGTYAGQVIIGSATPIAGASPANTIVFEGGNAATTIITASVQNAAAVILNQCKYVTFRNFTVINNAPGNCTGIGIVGIQNNNSSGTGCSIKNCIVNLPNAGTSTSYGINVTSSQNAYGQAGMGCDSVNIDSNTIRGGYFSIYVRGGGNNTLNRGIKIRNNTITNSYYYGMYVQSVQNAVDVLNNDVDMAIVNNNDQQGLFFDVNYNSSPTVSHRIAGNRITNASYTGMYIISTTNGSGAAPTLIYNNMIGGGYRSPSGIMGLRISGSDQTWVYHNTVNIDALANGNTCWALNFNGASSSMIKNNIFAVTFTTGSSLTVYPAYINSTVNAGNINANIYYNGYNANMIYRGNTTYTTANYKTAAAGGDSSFNINPGFLGNKDLRIANGCTRGADLTSVVPVDYAGATRSTTPSVGAHEFQSSSNDIAPVAILAPAAPYSAGTQDLSISVQNTGNNTITSFDIAYELNSGPAVAQTWTGSIAPCDTVTVVFTGAQQITLGTANSVKIYTSLPNLTSDSRRTNDTTGFYYYATALSGTYTIGGAGASFPDFMAAAGVLGTYGVSGPVTFLVNPGTYPGQVVIPSIPGADPVNTVTFDGGDGNAATRIISATLNQAPAFLINQSKYVTLRNLTITNSSGPSPIGIAITGSTSLNSGTGCAISNCIINLPNATGSNTSYGISVSSSANGWGQNACQADSLTIDSNTINNGYWGISIVGSSNSLYNRNINVRNNAALNTYYTGIYLNNIYNAINLLDNYVNMSPLNGSDQQGITFNNNRNASTTVPHRIHNNKVINAGFRGIYINQSMSAVTAAPTQVFNNMVGGGFRYNSTLYGIHMTGSTDVSWFYHNTMNMDYTPTGNNTVYGLYWAGSTASVFRNNIFAVTTLPLAGINTTTHPAYFNNNPVGNNVNYNVYYNTHSANLVYRSGSAFNSSNYRLTTSGGDSSYNMDPGFISSTDLRTNNGCARGMDATNMIPADITGTARFIPPVSGAYEFLSVSNDIAVQRIIAPVSPVAGGLQDLTVKVQNTGSSSLFFFNISYQLNGGAAVVMPWNGILNPCDTDWVTFTGPSQVNIGPGINNISIYTDYPNGGIDLNLENDTIKTSLYGALSGVYTIDPGGSGPSNYTSFVTAISDLELKGIAGPVTFNVAPGIYTGQLVVGNPAAPIQGVSAVNTITFDGGSASATTITANVQQGAALMMNQVNYLTFRNFTIINTNNSQGTAVAIIGNTTVANRSGSGLTVNNCTISLPNMPTNNTSYGILVTGAANGYSTNSCYIDSVNIDSNFISNAYSGIYMSQVSNNGYNRGFKIRNNTISNCYYNGIFIQSIYNPIDVLYNTINMSTAITNDMRGIYFNSTNNFSTTVPHRIIGNKVTNSAHAGMIISNTMSSTASAPTQIFNNMVGGGFRYNSTNIGIQISGNNDLVWCYHNTIHMDYAPQNNTVYGLYYSSGPVTSQFKNNIMACSYTSGTNVTTYPAYFTPNVNSGLINHNIYYNAYNSNVVYKNGTLYNTASYKTPAAGGDSSFNQDPGFVDSRDLRLTGGCIKGSYLTSVVTDDLFGNTRVMPPVIGAHEYQPLSNDATLLGLVQPTLPLPGGMQELTASIQNMGTNPIMSLQVTYRHNASTPVTQLWSGVLNTCDVADVTFTGAQQISIGAGANNITVYTGLPNGVPDDNRNNDTLKIIGAYASLNGVFTIDPGGSGPANFTSFAAAITELQTRGVSGPVTFLVAQGTYSGQINMGSFITGASSANTITFDGVDPSTTIITSNSSSNATVLLNLTRHVIFRNFTIINTASNGVGVGILGSTSNNSGSGCGVKRCTISLPNAGTNTSYGISVTASSGGYGSNSCYTDSVVIDSNTINGGYYGIRISGNSNNSYNRGFLIRGNNLVNTHHYGIMLQGIYNPIDLLNNTVTMATNNTNDQHGIYHDNNRNYSTTTPHRIDGNKIVNSGYKGIYISNTMNNTSVAPTLICNNMVGGGFRYNSEKYGIHITGNDIVRYLHNTVNMDSSSNNTSTVYGMYYSGQNSSIFRNNIFACTFTTGLNNVHPAYFNSNPLAGSVNSNIYYNAYNNNLLYRGGTIFTPANFNISTSGGDSSFNQNPGFISRTDLRIVRGCTKGADFTSLVPVDIEGNTRSTTPVIGAYEYPAPANDISVVAVVQPSLPFAPGFQDLIVRVQNTGNNPVTIFSIDYTLNNGPLTSQMWAGTLNPCDTVSVTFMGVNMLAGANNLMVATSLPNSMQDANPLNDTLKLLNTYASLDGVYTINPAGSGATNFASFAEALTALHQGGVSGPVTFQVAPGNYNGQIIVGGLNPIPGVSETNTVTFDGGNASGTTISASINQGPAVMINQASYITFRNFTIINNYGGSCTGVALIGSNTAGNTRGSNFTLANCIINLPSTPEGNQSYGFLITANTNGYSTSSCYNDSIRIDSNTFNRGYYGIYMSQPGNNLYNRDYKIRNNTLNSIYYYGMLIQSIYNPIDVVNNTINLSANYNSSNGIYFNSNYNSNTSVPHRITGNKVTNAGYIGMQIQYTTNNTAAAPTQVYNNMIAGGFRNTSNNYGFILNGSSGEVQWFYHNSVNMDFASNNVYALQYGGSNASRIMNNILACSFTPTTSTSNTVYAAYFNSNIGSNLANHNVYYNSYNGNLIYRSNTTYNGSNYKTANAGGDSSLNQDPGFISNTDLRVTNGCIRGTDLTATVPADYFGTTRTITPVIGAYEYPSSTDDIGITAIVEPALPFAPGFQDLRVSVQNNGGNPVYSFIISYRHNGGNPVSHTWFGILNPCDTASVVFTGSQQLDMSSSGNNLLVYTEVPNGMPDGNTTNDTLRISNLYPSLSGIYTINPAGSGPNNFASFASANTALLAGGVSGPVHFDVAPGTYPQVIIGGPSGVPGVSAANTITFDGGSAATTLITASVNAGAALIMNQVNHLTFRNFTITNTHNGQLSGVAIVGSTSQGNTRGTGSTLANCIVNLPNAPMGSNNVYGVVVTGQAAGYPHNSNYIDSLRIDSNIINGGYYGVMIAQPGNNLYNRGYRIRNNTIRNVHYYGLYVTSVYNPVEILNNSIDMASGNNGSYGIYFDNCRNSSTLIPHRIAGNKITGPGYCGIQLTAATNSTAASPTQVFNNMVAGGFRHTSENLGMSIGSNGNDVFLCYHNTVNMDFASNNVYAIRYQGATSISQIKNNIFAITYTSGSGTPYPAYFGTNPPLNAVNYNVYYNALNTNMVYRSGNLYNTATYKTQAVGGDSSFNFNPGFISKTDLRIANGCAKGFDCTSIVPGDHFGTTRTAPPVAGAHEFIPVSNDLSVAAITQPVPPYAQGAQNLRALVRNTGNSPVYSFNISYTLNNGAPVSQSWTGTLDPCDTVSILFSQQITLGTSNHVKIYTEFPNGFQDGDASNDSAYFSYYTLLNGTYTLGGPGANFPTFASATAALASAGISGPVRFLVNPGTYNEQVIVPTGITGSSPVNTITFDGTDAGTRIITASLNQTATVLMNQCRYVAFRDLTITNTFSGNSVGVAIIGNTSNNAGTGCSVKNCIVNLPNVPVNNTSYGISVTSATGGYGNGSNYIDSVAIDSNIVTGGYYGIYVWGNGNASYNRHHKIRNNTVNNLYYRGIQVQNVYNALDVMHNTVTMSVLNTNQQWGIYLENINNSSLTVPHRIHGNRVSNSGHIGMYIVNTMSSAAAASTQVYNNMVAGGFRYNSTNIGMQLSGSNDVTWFYHNSINMDHGPQNNSVYAMQHSGSAASQFKNNIFSCNLTGSNVTVYPAYFNSTITGNAINYNVYYNSYNNNMLYRSNTQYTTANYKTTAAGGDTSYNLLPPFVSFSDLHLQNGCFMPRGVNITSTVAADIDGQARAGAPNIGCDEYLLTSNDMGVTHILQPSFPYSTGVQDLRVRITNLGSGPVSSVTVGYILNGAPAVTQTWSAGTLGACDTASVLFAGVNIPATVSVLKVYTMNPNSATDGNPDNDTTTLLIQGSAMSGTYVIGSSPSDFPSFTAAITALQQRGLAGAVRFDVKPGTYTENLTITPPPGISALNHVTFQSPSGNPDSVVLTANTNTQATAVINLNASYFSFRHMTIWQQNNGSSGQSFNIVLNNSASYDTFYNCKINMPLTSNGCYQLYANSGTFHGIVFRKNIIQGSYNGLHLNSPSNALSDRWVIDSNTIRDITQQLFNFTYTANMKIRNNTIMVNGAFNSGSSFNFNQCDSAFEFAGNVITTGGAISNVSFNASNMIGNPTNRVRIYNNVINTNVNFQIQPAYNSSNYVDVFNNSFNLGSGYMQLGASTQNMRVYNNTVHSSNASYTVYFQNSGSATMDVRNNVFSNIGNGYAVYWTNTPTTETVDYNNLYTTGPALVFTNSPNNAYPNLASWRAAYGKDRSSISHLPGFTDPYSNLQPNVNDPACWSLNGRGVQIPGVLGDSSDITGNTRSVTLAGGAPDIGAYEFTPLTLPPLAAAIPATPVAGASQSFVFGQDTVARILWAAASPVPSSVAVRLYTGTIPPSISGGGDYMRTYWDVAVTPGTYNYNIYLHYDESWLGTTPNESSLRVAKYDTSWVPYTGTASSVDITNNIMAASGLTGFSLFTGTSNSNPLPVRLLDLAASLRGPDVVVKWSTVSELNSRSFEIERSADGKIFAYAGSVRASGTSSSVHKYSFTDEGIVAGAKTDVIYYRLKMTDKDGRFEYSGTVAVNLDEQGFEEKPVVYPNPFSENLYVKVASTSAGRASLTLTDIAGRVVFTRTEALEKGNNLVHLSDMDLRAGIYFMSIEVDNSRQLIKVIKK